MTLADRIRSAWLARNPRPEAAGDEAATALTQHLIDKMRLDKMLRAEAYESAVIQFLVPEGHDYEIGQYAKNFATGRVYPRGFMSGSSVYEGPTPAEALLNAIEEAGR